MRGKSGGGSFEIETMLLVEELGTKCGGKSGGGSFEIEILLRHYLQETVHLWQERWWLI